MAKSNKIADVKVSKTGKLTTKLIKSPKSTKTDDKDKTGKKPMVATTVSTRKKKDLPTNGKEFIKQVVSYYSEQLELAEQRVKKVVALEAKIRKLECFDEEKVKVTYHNTADDIPVIRFILNIEDTKRISLFKKVCEKNKYLHQVWKHIFFLVPEELDFHFFRKYECMGL